MKTTLLAAALAILAIGTARAQSVPKKADCSIMLSVSGADEAPQGEDLTFTANLSGGPEDAKPTYQWSVSAGSIEAGQGTPSITLSSKGMKAGETVTATVDIGGLPAECGYNSDSYTTGITAAPPKKPAKRSRP